MRKIKDKTNILVIMQSIAKQMFALQVFNIGNKEKINKKIKIIKQYFENYPQLKRQLRIRKLLQQLSVKNKQERQRLVQQFVLSSKKIDNIKIKKKLMSLLGQKQEFWIKPNKLQQRVGNLLNNGKYYGMSFYKQQQEQVRQVLNQWFLRKDNNIIKQNLNIQELCQKFNSKYTQLPQRNKNLINQMFNGNHIDQKKVLKQITQYKQKLSQQSKKKLQYIVQNVSMLDKFDKVFILTSILQENKDVE